MNRCLEELCRRLDESGVEYRIEDHPFAMTTERVADLAHVPGHTFAKAVVVVADGAFILVALPAPHVVDLLALREELGIGEARLATEEEFAPLFPGCPVGTMPPFPGSHGLPLYVDKGLLGHPEIVFEAGSRVETVRMRTQDYVWVAQPHIVNVAREHVAPEPK